jgi:hypothetical protein
MVPGTFLVSADDIEQARDQTYQGYLELHPELVEQRERLFRERLSPTGENPPSHYLCWYANMTDALWAEICEYITAHNLRVIPERMTEGKTKPQFLAEKGLRRIGAK